MDQAALSQNCAIVDMHCHLAGIGAGGSGCFVSERLRRNWRFGIYLKTFGVTRRELEQQGDDLVADRVSSLLSESRRVSHAVVLALDGVVDATGQLDTNHTEVYVPNEFVFRATQRHPNLLFGASVNPCRKDALERLEWAKAHGAVLVKWLPAIMRFDPATPGLAPFYRKLVELDLPLLTHTGREGSFSAADEELCDPERLRLALRLGVKVIAAHAASSACYQGEPGPERLARLMREFPNLSADISALTQINKHGSLRRALARPEFRGRLLYGSDFPLINTALVWPWQYLFELGWRKTSAIARLSNPWDADVTLKEALGTPACVFENSLLTSPLNLRDSRRCSRFFNPQPRDPLGRGGDVSSPVPGFSHT
jgi:hypothetical protein